MNGDVVVADLLKTRVVDRLPLAPLRHLTMARDGAGTQTEGRPAEVLAAETFIDGPPLDVDAEDVSELDAGAATFGGSIAAAEAPRRHLIFVRHGADIIVTAVHRLGAERDDGEGRAVGAAVERRNDDATRFAAEGGRTIAGGPLSVIRDDAVLRAGQDAAFAPFRFGGEMRADVVLVNAVGPSVFADDVASPDAALDAATVVEGVDGVAKAMVTDADQIVDHLVQQPHRSVFQLAFRPRRLVPAQPLPVVVAHFEAGTPDFGARELRAVVRMRFPLARRVYAFDRPDLDTAVAARRRFAVAPRTRAPRVGRRRRRMNGDLEAFEAAGERRGGEMRERKRMEEIEERRKEERRKGGGLQYPWAGERRRSGDRKRKQKRDRRERKRVENRVEERIEEERE